MSKPAAAPLQPAQPTACSGPALVDRFGRVHDSLRISVTDRCNIRCFYCMSDGPIEFLPRADLLTFEEITRVVAVAARLGVRQLRLTGGEPLVRQELWRLVEMLRAIAGIEDLAMTTNATLLEGQAQALRDAGLDRLNISLDSLRAEVFRTITRRDQLDAVLRGIAAAQTTGFASIRINAVSIAGLTEPDIVPLARFCLERGLHLRFIEYMPLDADGRWSGEQVLRGATVRAMLEAELGALVPDPENDPHQPARDWCLASGGGKIGFINAVSEPFCGDCNRLRLTAEGQLRNCLFAREETDLRHLLRGGGDDEALAAAMQESVRAKKRGHGIDEPGFAPPLRAMYQIGG
jgi:GTP 3',8-cyclase